MTRPTPADYRACADEGLSITEAGRRLGVSHGTVRRNALKLGLTFVNKQDEARAANIRGMHANPEHVAKWRAALRAAGRWPRNQMTEAEWRDYRTLTRARYARDEAFRAVGRADLIQEAAE